MREAERRSEGDTVGDGEWGHSGRLAQREVSAAGSRSARRVERTACDSGADSGASPCHRSEQYEDSIEPPTPRKPQSSGQLRLRSTPTQEGITACGCRVLRHSCSPPSRCIGLVVQAANTQARPTLPDTSRPDLATALIVSPVPGCTILRRG